MEEDVHMHAFSHFNFSLLCTCGRWPTDLNRAIHTIKRSQPCSCQSLQIHLVDEFDILQIVGEGWFGKILLVEHRASQTEMVLKAVPKPYVSLRDFYREFHYGLHLGIHRNIVTTYDVAFETAGFYVFTQEYAPLGDLTSNVTETGIGELHSKRVAKQIACALDYMHSKDIVHRDVKLDNVLIYRSDFSRVKLCDFGESVQAGTTVERRNEWLPYSPPEVLQIKPEGTYKADSSHDVWQFGIVIFVCLTGCLPWQKAASDDPRYVRYLAWQGTMMLPIRRTPKLFKLLASKASRMFRRFLEPRNERRPKSLADLAKFMDDRWLAKSAEKDMAEYETDELCPSMYSFHSSPDEKHRLLRTLVACGIESNVDRAAKKNRIKDWIESSIITEEDENEEETESASASPSSSVSREPVAGHISSIRTNEPIKKEIKTTLKDANQKHFDPRTGALQQGPSSMGRVYQSPSPTENASITSSMDSLKGSILTLGSRQEILSSDFHLYASELNVHALGEQPTQHMVSPPNGMSHSLSFNHLSSDAVTRINNNFASGTSTVVKKNVLQRTRSDSAKLAMANSKLYASSSALDTNHFDGPTYAGGHPNTNGNNVSFVGLTNAFQSLATMPIDQASSFVSFHSRQSEVKDSGYGSTTTTNDDGHSTKWVTAEDISINDNMQNPRVQVQVNGKGQYHRQGVHTSGHFNGGASMKDTPYDRVSGSKKKQ